MSVPAGIGVVIWPGSKGCMKCRRCQAVRHRCVVTVLALRVWWIHSVGRTTAVAMDLVVSVVKASRGPSGGLMADLFDR